ncbi:MAG: DUF3344 domain-containing protein [Methanosarcinales archaeon]|nr:DUF3344 domain-containing protein [Methanosarcinales archaeon]
MKKLGLLLLGLLLLITAGFAQSSPFLIYGSVNYENGTGCNLPFVVVNNLNTSEMLTAQNRTGEYFYQLVGSSMFIKSGDILQIKAYKDGTPIGNTIHTVNQTDIEHGVIVVNINDKLINQSLFDFAVTNLSLFPVEPVLGDNIDINAHISNYGDRDGTTSVGVFYDNTSMEIERAIRLEIRSDDENYTSVDNISLPPGILGARFHFNYLDIYNGHIDICDDNGQVIQTFPSMEINDNISVWTDWIYSENISIRTVLPFNPKLCTHWCNFNIDRYEALIAEELVTLNTTESKTINTSWPTGTAYGGAREHNITARIDLHNAFVENNETNNNFSRQVFVNGTDLAITDIEIPCGRNIDEPCCNEQEVNITVKIANLGAVDATDFTVIIQDGNCSNCSNANTSGIIFNKTIINHLKSGEEIIVPVIWNPNKTGYHTVQASISYNNIDNNKTNNNMSKCSLVLAKYDFIVENVMIEPHTVTKGENVNITATIGSIGYMGENVSIAFFVNNTDFIGTGGEWFTRIGILNDIYIGANDSKTVSMTWKVNEVGGDHMIAAVVNPDNVIEENYGTNYCLDTIIVKGNDTGNNVKTSTLHVISPELHILNLTFIPDHPNIGDTVKVGADIINNGTAEANSEVWFYIEKEELINHSHIGENPTSEPISLVLSRSEDIPVRVHFDRIEILCAGEINASITDKQNRQHTLPFFIKPKEAGGQVAKVPGINYYTPGFEEDGIKRYWDDVWTDWTNSTELEICGIASATTEDSIVYITIDKYQVRLGNNTVILDPDNVKSYYHIWNSSFPSKPGENCTLAVSVENEIERKETEIGGTNLTIANLSVQPKVLDDDKVWINTTVKNDGLMNATDFIVNISTVYYCEGIPDKRKSQTVFKEINTTYIKNLKAGSSTNISILWDANIEEIICNGECRRGSWKPCSWNEITDDYKVIVEINPLKNERYEENPDYSKEVDVTINRSRDFWITDISFMKNNKFCDPSELEVYDEVTLIATFNITNLVNYSDSVNVSFYIDHYENEIGSKNVVFPGGNGTQCAQINWRVEDFDDEDIPGNHNMIVVVDWQNRTIEINETNNTFEYPIHVMASDILVESLSINPKNPMKDDNVKIDATIANYGKKLANNITLSIFNWSERHIEEISEHIELEHEQIDIYRENVTAMRLYLDLKIGEGKVYINDTNGSTIQCYNHSFHGWTPWIFNNNITVVMINDEINSAYTKVSKIYYFTPGSLINTSTHEIGINGKKNISINWKASVIGENFIVAIADPEDRITEYNELNNKFAELIHVQTADLIISDIVLQWPNGTEIYGSDTLYYNNTVNIIANIVNTGVEDAGSFNARFLVDDVLIKEEIIPDLAKGSTVSMSINWKVKVGNHRIVVEVDRGNEIDETNETNNIAALKRYVCGAELSGNTSWETLGLHGEILFDPAQPFDEDEVSITAIVNNSGSICATDFGAALFFNYEPEIYHKCANSFEAKWRYWNYEDAVSVYFYITIIQHQILGIYDGNNNLVKKVDRSSWVQVPGDTINITYFDPVNSYIPDYTISFYPVYPDNLSRIMELKSNTSEQLPPIKQNVSAGNHTILLFIDPENKVPEDEDYKGNNIISSVMNVKPTRDFSVEYVTEPMANLSDSGTIDIFALISNTGYRNGMTKVNFIDYKEDNRAYKYHFDTNLSPPYLPISPNASLLNSEYEDVTIIHRPGVDAISLNFSRILLNKPTGKIPSGKISVCNDSQEIWGDESGSDKSKKIENMNITVGGETVYIFTTNAKVDPYGYNTETGFFKKDVVLNATKTWNESKNITSKWTAHTGNHTILFAIDHDDNISEINESDNELTSLFNVKPLKDPAVVRLNYTPQHPGEGDSVNIAAVVINNGNITTDFTVDIWANTTRKNETPGSLPQANLIIYPEDKIRYITLLNHTNVTLAPGENVTVFANWDDISVADSPTHIITAIVDPIDEIDEMNESNNSISSEIVMSFSDFFIGRFRSDGEGANAAVNIKEGGGACGASDVTVQFETYETEECREGCGIIRHFDAANMQVYFADLDSRNGFVEVRNRDTRSVDKPPIIKYPQIYLSGVWSPWVEGDKVYIICSGAGSRVNINKYKWGNITDENIDFLDPHGHEWIEIPWEFKYPRKINVVIDPDNNITELNEDNNNETVLVYADIVAKDIEFFSPQQSYLCLDVEEFVIDGVITNGIDDGIVFPVSNFDVTLEFRESHPNGTTGDVIFNITRHINDPLYAFEEKKVRFKFDPKKKLKTGGNYTVRLIADIFDNVCESSDQYPDKEDWDKKGEHNNVISEDIFVYNSSGYTGGGDLINIARGEIFGRVLYTTGNYNYSGLITPEDNQVSVKYTDIIPEDAGDIEFARLFVYWYTWHKVNNKIVPVLADVQVDFNNQYNLDKAGNYSDNPGATTYDAGYGLYSYDVTDYVTPGDNKASLRNIADWNMGVHAIGLVVVYEDKDDPLTKYWINEGADIIMPANKNHNTGLPPATVTGYFEGIELNDTQKVNATLLTILGMYSPHPAIDGGIGDALKFNSKKVGSDNKDHWKKVKNKDKFEPIGYPPEFPEKNKWEEVEEYLKSENNIVEIYTKSNFMMPNNAFLRLIFPPDLNVKNMDAPTSAVIGNKYIINTTITNEGKGNASEFNVSFYSDNLVIKRERISRLKPGDNISLQFDWKPMSMGKLYKLKVKADILSGPDWIELDTDNNEMIKDVPIVGSGFGDEPGPIGDGKAGPGGSGEGSGIKLVDTITGYLMNGSILGEGGGGGGGAGEFSLLEWLIRGMILFTGGLLIFTGYSLEKKRRNKKKE